MACESFGFYFNENLRAMGLQAWDDIPTTKNAIVAEVAALATALRTLGKGATVAELVGATTAIDLAALALGGYASFYVGACIGSAFVATVKYENCHNANRRGLGGQMRRRIRLRQHSAEDVLTFMQVHGLYSDDAASILRSYPAIYNDDIGGKRKLAYLAADRAEKAIA